MRTEPLTSKVIIKALWKKEQIDLAELARLRWVEKWRYERLADHFGVGRTTVRRFLGQIKDNPKIAALAQRPPAIRGS